jgi:RNA polymerase sigma factor (TIGR02999 family)
MSSMMSDETIALDGAGAGAGPGGRRSTDELLPRVYEELHRLAVAHMAREAAGHTLQPTALVHEAYLRLSREGEDRLWDNTGHFFSAAAEAMRRILIERARARQCQKRGGDRDRQTIDLLQVSLPEIPDDLLAVNEALERLERAEPRLAELVKLRYFVGMTIKEAAEVIGVSPRTADSDWAYARAWLLAEMSGDDG